MLVHGDSGTGKTWLFNTAPGPRLLLDAEGRAEYLADLRKDPSGVVPQEIVRWDPRTPLPSESSNPDIVTVTDVHTWADIEMAYNVLKTGEHPFRAVGLDSLQETQQRLIYDIAKVDQMRTQDWGEALRRLDALVRDMRDLRRHRTNPLDVLVVIAGSAEKDGKARPMLQGQMALRVPYHFDVVGYLQKGLDSEQRPVRYMTIDGYVAGVLAKDNTHLLAHANPSGHIVSPDISAILNTLNPQETS